MLHPGVCSITFRQLDPEAVVELVASTKLTHIEWGSDIHAPAGDRDRAQRVARWTTDAGLAVSSYGSYFKAGVTPGDDQPGFDAVLDTAEALGAPVIRVWAGAHRGQGVPEDPAMFDRAVAELRAAGEAAAQAGVKLGIEYHPGSFTATPASAARLIEAVGLEAVGLYWQPNQHATDESQRRESLEAALAHLVHLHVFHWTKEESKVTRRPLAAGADLWRPRLAAAAKQGPDHAALLEFVADNDPGQFREDAATLVTLIDEATAGTTGKADP